MRHEHPGWIVLWLPHLGWFRAYPLVLELRRPIVTAPAAQELAALMEQAELDYPAPRPRRPAASTARPS